MLSTLFYFTLALVILIAVHEFGHFIVARMCGVKVLRFSLGFGKVLAKVKGKYGTEYSLSAIPLGGYVKMLDESEGDVLPSEKHLAFNNQSVWARIAIIIAGPLFNFIFAFFALWLVWMIGFYSLAPMIDKVTPGSIAQKAGLSAEQEILSVDGKKIDSWRDFQYAMMSLLGTDTPVSMQVKSKTDKATYSIQLPLANWKIDAKKPDLLKSIGIVPFVPKIPPVIGSVMPDGPAYSVGLKSGDRVTAIDKQKIESWLEMAEYVREHPNRLVHIDIQRGQKHLAFDVRIKSTNQKGKAQGVLGVKSLKMDWPKHWLRIQQAGPIEAAYKAATQMLRLSGTTVVLMGRLAIGKIPLDNISGPVGIAQGAGASAKHGMTYYLSFLALVSISLGILNLLPIPILDGGHLMYCLIEAVRKKPVSDEFKSAGMYVGMFFLVALMVLALTNDIVRVLS